MKPAVVLSWVLRVIAAGILLQSVYYKFTGAPESIALFTKLGMEPTGRWLIGALEVMASALLLLPGSAAIGALLTLGLMSGAIFAHAARLGWGGDMLALGASAVTAWLAAAVVLFLERRRIPFADRIAGRGAAQTDH